MKKNIFSWLTIALMAIVCVGFAACGSDDDDNGGGGGGANSGSGGEGINGAVIDGKIVNTSYAFWCYSKWDERWFLVFYDKDPRGRLDMGNFLSYPNNVVSIDFEGEEGSEVPTGEFDDFNVYVANGMNTNSEGEQMEKPRDKEGKLVITKSGNNYSVSYTGVSLSNDEKTITNTSFSYTGPLTYLKLW